ncbi:heterokaryon incompatibility protein-domain-containing protein [Nemania sp. NC0429]|nr:heterokaryon incompatibility protein-domain-containing protein [Nemania sp. NC0429]
MCALFEHAVVAVVDGKLQDLFGGLEDSSQRVEILENIIIRPEYEKQDQQECYLDFLIKGDPFNKRVQMFRDIENQTIPIVYGFTFPPYLPFGPGINPSHGFGWAKQRLSECLTHQECQQLVQSPFPKRMIAIEGDKVKLVKTTGSERPYVSLSYRWGGREHKRLISTVKTIDDYEKGIPWTALPKTFQDAVTICQVLEVSYLWIDALCILQQSPNLTKAESVITAEDFAEENSIMAGIYKGSHFTICADISTSMDSGIFSTGALTRCLPLTIPGDDGEDTTVYARADQIYHNENQFDIETRGWTLQEFLLPPRVLHFGEFDITWRCRKVHTCQCGDIDNGRGYTWRETLAKAAKEVPQDPDEALEWWAIVVSFYQPRKLSDGFDKLPALSGLAQEYIAATGHSYKAGLWENSLLHDLCWYNWREYENTDALLLVGNRAAEHRAPSWSWASINVLDGVTSYFWSPGEDSLHPIRPFGRQRSVCVVHDIDCRPQKLGRKSDATGAVDMSHCKIELGVKLIPVIIAERTPRGITRKSIPWTLDGIDDGIHVQFCMPDCEMDDDGLKGGDKVYCAPIQEALSKEASQRGCLVLKHLKDQQYKRIGFCVLMKNSPTFRGEEQDERGYDSPLDRGSLDLTSPETASWIQSHGLQFDPETADRITIV